jgi:hypothetical protein
MPVRQRPLIDVVVRVALISLLGLSVARAQTTPPAAVAVTFPAREANVQLTGQLYPPAGEGPFPAVVFLHGCAGIDPVQHHWAHRLQQWGYLVLLVDSFGPPCIRQPRGPPPGGRPVRVGASGRAPRGGRHPSGDGGQTLPRAAPRAETVGSRPPPASHLVCP